MLQYAQPYSKVILLTSQNIVFKQKFDIGQYHLLLNCYIVVKNR